VAQDRAVVLLRDFDHGPGDHWAGKTRPEKVFSMLAGMSISGQVEYLTSVLVDCVACGSQVSAGSSNSLQDAERADAH